MRKYLKIAFVLVVFVGGYFAWKAEQPIARSPAPEWQASITSPDFTTETFFVPVEGAEIEAMILRPNNGAEPMGAVVFAGGSGDGVFQNYAPGFLKTYLQDIFLPRGIAVVFTNKRGMGASTGNWMNNTLEGRAADLSAVANAVRGMPEIDAARVGIAGHSQGGWVVIRAAAEDSQTAFVLNFMGPLRSTNDQFEYQWHSLYRCDGMTEDEIESAYARKDGLTRFALHVGRVLPIGMLEFDSKFFNYDNAGLLQRISAPVLSVYGGTDVLVDGAANEAYLASEFPQGVPDHLEAVTIPHLNHRGYQRADVCDTTTGVGPEDASLEMIALIDGWLVRMGY